MWCQPRINKPMSCMCAVATLFDYILRTLPPQLKPKAKAQTFQQQTSKSISSQFGSGKWPVYWDHDSLTTSPGSLRSIQASNVQHQVAGSFNACVSPEGSNQSPSLGDHWMCFKCVIKTWTIWTLQYQKWNLNLMMYNEWKRIQPETKNWRYEGRFLQRSLACHAQTSLSESCQVAGMERPWRMAASMLCSICSHPSTSISVLKWLVISSSRLRPISAAFPPDKTIKVRNSSKNPQTKYVFFSAVSLTQILATKTQPGVENLPLPLGVYLSRRLWLPARFDCWDHLAGPLRCCPTKCHGAWRCARPFEVSWAWHGWYGCAMPRVEDVFLLIFFGKWHENNIKQLGFHLRFSVNRTWPW